MRLFIALPLKDELKQLLADTISNLQKSEANIKWVDPKNIHMTVKFLGDTEENLIPRISEAIKKTAMLFDPVKGVIDRLGGFPNLHKARVYWAGFSNSPPVLNDIAQKIDNEMHRLGFEKESRSFKSHLTIGRVKDSRTLGGLPDQIKSYQFDGLTTEFSEIVLFKSTLTPRGPIYDRLFAAKLKKLETFS